MGSASGQKTEVFNPRERAISSDLNRLQSFHGADLAAALAQLLDQAGDDAASSSGNTAVSSATVAPAQGQILGGLQVMPQMGSVNTLVSAGVVILCNPDGVPNPDDNAYKLVNDPGVSNGASLPLVPNISGSTEIHIVECQRNDTALETDNRDIFNPSTGLFTPASVNKVVASRLTYRIRVGTLAAGVTTASGWLPLMVALVPNGATTWNDCPYLWDVRPLVLDRALTCGANTKTTFPVVSSDFAGIQEGTNILSGHVEVVGTNGRKLGGDLAYSPADVGLDLTSTELRVTGFAFGSNNPWHIYLCEPFGLPRWCRYTSVASGIRLPGRLRGMPVMSQACKPTPTSNLNTFTIPSPTAFGFPNDVAANISGPSNRAVCIYSGFSTAGGTMMQRGWGSRGLVEGITPIGPNIVAPVKTPSAATWTIAPGTHFPSNVTAIKVGVTVVFTGVPSPNSGDVPWGIDVADRVGTVGSSVLDNGIVHATAGQNYTFLWTGWVPIDSAYPTVSYPTIGFRAVYNGATLGYVAAPVTCILDILGYRLAVR